MIRIEELTHEYRDGTLALKGINLEIGAHTKTAVLGPNGSGKSTLLLHLNGIHIPQEGKVEVLGLSISKKTEKQIKSRVGLVFQDPDDQVFSSTVWDDVAFGPQNMGLSEEEIASRVEKALKAVKMWDWKDKSPYHLSYGQKKRVAIAGILAMDCEIIVLDEPVAYLDPEGKDSLFGLLDELYGQGVSIVIATHDVDLACEWAQEVILIRNGQVLAQGGPELLVDETLIEKASLRLPVVAQLFKMLEPEMEKYPGSLKEAVEHIRRWRTQG